MDWKKLINRIRRYGKLTDAQIGEEVGSTQQNINALKIGLSSDPHWELGEKLIELDRKVKND